MTAVGTVGNMPIPVIANGSGTAQAGAASSLTLNTLASAIADAYKYMQVHILSGTGAGQERNVVSSRKNLLKYSQALDNVAWSKANATIVANATTAPDGTVTAEKLVEGAVTNEHYVTYASTWLAGVRNTLSFHAAAAERGFVTCFIANRDAGGFSRIRFNLSTGAATAISSNGNLTVNSPVSVNYGFWRFSVTMDGGIGAVNPLFVFETDTGSLFNYAGDGSSGIYLWGAQLEVGSAATPYIHTEANAAVGIAIDRPWDTQPDATSSYEIYIAGKTPVGVLSPPAFIVGALTQPTFITGTVGP